MNDLAPSLPGWYWDGSASDTGKSVVMMLLSGLDISIVPTRSGALRPIFLARAAADAAVSFDITADAVTALCPVALDGSLDLPRWR